MRDETRRATVPSMPAPSRVESPLWTQPMFASLSPRQLERMDALVCRVHIPAGAEVVSRADTRHTLAVIVDGRAQAFDGHRSIRALGPNDAFGAELGRDMVDPFAHARAMTEGPSYRSADGSLSLQAVTDVVVDLLDLQVASVVIDADRQPTTPGADMNADDGVRRRDTAGDPVRVGRWASVAILVGLVAVAAWLLSGCQPQEPPPTATVTVTGATGAEPAGATGSTTVPVTVSLSGPVPSPVTVDWTTADGSATAASGDYQSATGTVTFAPNETSKTIDVAIEADDRHENSEVFQVNLAAPTGSAILGADATASVTITDDPSDIFGDCTKWAVAGSVSWDNPDHWTPVGAPGSDDVVCATKDSSISMSTSGTVRGVGILGSLNIPGGTWLSVTDATAPWVANNVGISGQLNVAGDLTLSGASGITGAIFGPGTVTVEAGATLQFWMGGLHQGATLSNHGTVTWAEDWWAGTTFDVCDGSQVINHGLFVMDGYNARTMTDCGAITSRITNAADGTITFSIYYTRAFDIEFVNHGAVTVTHGTILLNRANTIPHTGTFTIADPGTLNLRAKTIGITTTHQFGATARVAGTSGLVLDDAWATANGAPGSQFSNVAITAGVLTGSPTITSGGSLWAPGRINGPGTTTIAAGAHFYWFSGMLGDAVVLENHGIFDWTETWWDAHSGSVSLCDGARIENHGVLDATGSETQSMLDCGSTSSKLVNHSDGTIDASVPAWKNGTRNFYVDVENAGTVNVLDGGLNLYRANSTPYGGTFNLPLATSALRPTVPSVDPVTHTFGPSAVVSGSGALTIDTMFTTVDAAVGATFSNVSLLNGVLTGDPTITGGGAMRAPGMISGPGTTTIASGAYFYWFTGTLDNGAVIDNQGTLDWSENWWDAHDGSVSMCGGSRIDNHGLLDATGIRTQSMLDCGGNPALVNHTDGTMDVSTTSWMGTTRNIYVEFRNDGRLNLTEGRMYVDHGVGNVVGDTITGGTFNLSGTLSVGTTTTGQVTTNASNLTFHPAGALLTGAGQPLLALATNGPAGQLTYDRDDTIDALVNQGSVVVSSGRTLTAAAYAQTAGSTTLAGGTVAVTGGTFVLDGGTLGGVGVIDGSLANDATVTIGAVASVTESITVTGGYTSTPTSHVAFHPERYASDTFTVMGAATLAGTLDITGSPIDVPQHGQSFLVMHSSAFAGQFDQITGATFPGAAYVAGYSVNSVTLEVLAIPAGCDAMWVAVTGDFAVATNWYPALVPGAGQRVCSTPGTTMTVSDSRTVGSAGLAGALAVTASGSLTVDGAVPASSIGAAQIDGRFNLAAGVTVDVNSFAQNGTAATDLATSSTLRIGAGAGTAALDGGTLAGSGTIAGNAAGGATINAGSFGVAESRGTLTITGDYTPTAGAQLVTDVVDATWGSGYDQLMVNGTASVSSLHVVVQLAAGTQGPVGSLFPLTAGTRSGAIAGATLPSGTGVLWEATNFKTTQVIVQGHAFTLTGRAFSQHQPLTLTASVSFGASSPTGTVTFRDGATVIGTAPFVANAASLTVPELSPGPHALTASYDGDAYFRDGVTQIFTNTVLGCDVLAPAVNLDNCDLTGRDLTNVDLTGASLRHANLHHAELDGAILTGADLTAVGSGAITGSPAALPAPWRLLGGYLVGPGADLRGANFEVSTGVNLSGADLSGADLTGATFWSNGFFGADLHGATMAGVDLRGAIVVNSDFRGAVLDGALIGELTPGFAPGQLVNNDFTGASFVTTDLRRLRISSNLTDANLQAASMNGTDFGGSNLTGARMSSVFVHDTGSCTDVIGVPASMPVGWQVVRNRLVGPNTKICDADLSGLDLTTVDLHSAHVVTSNLSNTLLAGVNLRGADIADTTFGGATLAGTDLTGATLTSVALAGADLSHADLTSVTLTSVTLTGANLRHADLTSVTLSGVTATAGADFTGATLRSMTLGFSNDLRLAVLTGVRSGGITGPSYSTQLPAGWKFLTTHNVPGGLEGHLAGPGADLSGETISGVQADAFDGVSLAGANLAGSTIAAHFTNTDFQGANLTNTTFQPFGTTFSHVHSGGIVGSPASLPSGGWTLKAGHLVGPWADLHDADLATVDLTGANLYGANLAGAGLAGANLAGADLDRADLSGADLTDASGLPLHYASATYGNTTCPDHSNSDTNAGTCANHPWGYVACAPGPGADLSYCDLHGADLSHLDLAGAIFVGADLSDADLTLANLTGADLREANLERTNLASAALSGVRSGGGAGMPFVTAPFRVQYGYLIGPYVDLAGIDLTGQWLVGGQSLYGARLVGAHLDGAYLDHVDFSEADLTGATVTGADTSWASFKDANLTGADFTGSSLLAADLRGANLTGARLVNNDLFGVQLDRANLENVTVDQTTLWGARGRDIVGTAAQLPAGTRIVHGTLVGPGAIVDGGDLAGEDLSDLSLARTSFWGVDLSGTSFVGVDLTDSIFSGANLTGTRFDGANLTNVGLYSVEVGGADFTGAQVAVPASCSITGTPASLPAPYRLTRGFLVGPGTRFVACSGATVDLAGADLSGADLSGASLRGADLSGADLTGAAFRDADLDGAILTGAVVTNTDFTATALIRVRSGGLVGAPAVLPLFWAPFDGYLVGPGANLAGANFADTDLRGLWMSNTNLTGTDLRRAVLTGVNLVGADLTGALVAGASFAGADLGQADLTGLDFAGIDLSGADLQLAWLDGADLSSALLARAHTASVRGIPAALPAGWFQYDRTLLGAGADLHLADLSGIDLAGRDLRAFDFTGVVLDGADLSNADLTGVRLTSAWAQSANLAGAVLVGADLSSANLYGANLAGALLVGADLSWASIHQSNLVGADLSGATATSTYFREADLSGATLANLSGYGSNFELAQVVGADLSHADLTRSYSPGANFAGADFTGTTFWVAELPGANLAGARLSGAHVRQADLSGVDLTDADLSSATLLDTNLAGATLVRADLTGVTAERSIITGADVTGTMLAGSGLHRVVSGGLTGVPASLPGRAVVVNGYLVGRDADLTSADLTGADLTGVDLGEARVQDTDLTGATLDGVSSGWISGYPTALPAGWSVVGNGYLVGPGADLIGANLGGADLRNLIAKGTNFRDADLSYADLSGARLGGATFTGSNLSHTQMHATDLDEADLSSANLYGVSSSDITTTPTALPAGWQLVRGHLVGAGAFLSGADLGGADLSGIDLSGATFETAVLAGADLSGADLHGASLFDAHLAGADLTGADLTGTFGWWADLTGATLTGATITDANFANAIFTGVISGGVIGQPADSVNRPHFVQGYFIGAGSNLTGADLAGADLRGYGLPGAVLVDADLSNAQLDGVDLTGANLHGVTFEYTSAVSVGLYGADLSGATIRKSDLHGAGLANADLTNATITDSNLDGAVFADATLAGIVSSGNSGTPIYLPAGWSWVGGAFVGP